ncbi:DAO domain-containing protein [Mycena chlorophos]|uniref:DAO domain-containing protein n=1 Tax=Mycena chlorophos TaxID=658473 RepID=A0A8H6TMZ4_MYCCL|nr:DAO domain-containing protein [Mycena chlorophos]
MLLPALDCGGRKLSRVSQGERKEERDVGVRAGASAGFATGWLWRGCEPMVEVLLEADGVDIEDSLVRMEVLELDALDDDDDADWFCGGCRRGRLASTRLYSTLVKALTACMCRTATSSTTGNIVTTMSESSRPAPPTPLTRLESTMSAPRKTVIIGSGCFGLSTHCISFSADGQVCDSMFSTGRFPLDADITILDKAPTLANDFNRINVLLTLVCRQSVAMVQLTAAEGLAYRDIPVILESENGFYIFPPNDKNIVKKAIHAAGYTHSQPVGTKSVSTPRTILSNPTDGLRIPNEKVRDLRAGLRAMYPALAEKTFVATRLHGCF